MRRKLWKWIIMLCMVMLLAIPVEAASEEVITSLETETTETENDWMNESPQLDHVTDAVGLLTDEQWQELELQARAIEEQYGFSVYAVAVNDFCDYTDGSVQDAAEEIYKTYSLGAGSEKDGVMLLLSMNDRDFSLITHGSYGNYAFNDEGRVYLTEYFLDDFAENDWYAGFEEYISWSGSYLEAAKTGEPYSDANVPMSDSERLAAIGMYAAAILLIPLVIAAIYVGVLTSKMKSVAEATKASAYVAGNLKLNSKVDRFTHRTETRTKIEKDSDSSSGSRSSSGGSSGFSGTSGKF